MAVFPITPHSLLSQLRGGDGVLCWQLSWKRFVELYHDPLSMAVHACFRHHTGGRTVDPAWVEDVLAMVMVEFLQKGQYRYDDGKGRLRTFLRVLVNARVIDQLRKDRPFDHVPLSLEEAEANLPPESSLESEAYQRTLLLTLVEELREQVPLRQFEIFERVKLKGRKPEEVAKELGVSRGVIDHTIYKVMIRLREIAELPEYREEYYSTPH